MAGINLSQSFESKVGKEDKKEKLFDSGFIISLSLFIIILIGWGGLHYYSLSLGKELASLDTTIAERNQELEGALAGRIVDFDTRMSLISKNATDRSNPDELFLQLENMMVPSVALLQYEYNKQDSVMTFMATTDNFRYIAEQIISLKSSGGFSDVKVDSIDRNKEGKVIFTLKAHL